MEQSISDIGDLFSIDKHVYAIYWKFFYHKNVNIKLKNLDRFPITAQNINCRYLYLIRWF